MQPPTAALVALGYQGIIVGAFCFVGWTALLQHIPASKLAVFAFASPVFGVIFSYLLLGEPVTGRLFAGVVMVASGIAIAARS